MDTPHNERRGEPADEKRRVEATAAHLAALLSTPGLVARWRPYVVRDRLGGLHQGAIAQVLAQYLWDEGIRSEEDVDLPRRLKDPVNRALRGVALPTRTLGLFIRAFDIDPGDAQQLWALRCDADPTTIRLLRHEIAEGALIEARRRRYQTISLHEFHHIGSDGLPESHRTVQVIRADEALGSFEYRFDTDAAVVEMIRGGSVGPVKTSAIPGIYGCTIHFSKPLKPGETGSFEYRTLFAHQTPPPKEFRLEGRNLANVDLEVSFHVRAVPRRLFFATWPGLDAETGATLEPLRLDDGLRAQRFVERIDDFMVGFIWE